MGTRQTTRYDPGKSHLVDGHRVSFPFFLRLAETKPDPQLSGVRLNPNGSDVDNMCFLSRTTVDLQTGSYTEVPLGVTVAVSCILISVGRDRARPNSLEISRYLDGGRVQEAGLGIH